MQGLLVSAEPIGGKAAIEPEPTIIHAILPFFDRDLRQSRNCARSSGSSLPINPTLAVRSASLGSCVSANWRSIALQVRR